MDTETREMRPCKRCGFERMVKVRKDHFATARTGVPKVSWEPNCKPCQDLLNAAGKFNAACDFYLRAMKGYEKRGLHKDDVAKLLQTDLHEAILGMAERRRRKA